MTRNQKLDRALRGGKGSWKVISLILLTGVMDKSAFLRSALLVAVATAGGACATTRAEVPRERPALDVPMPPPRVIEPLPVPDPPPVQPVGELPGGSTPAPPRPRPQRPPENNNSKSESKPEEPKQAETPPPANPPPVPQLSIPEAVDASKLTGQIRGTIERTRAALERIDYGPLSDTRKKTYNEVKLFADQAEAELKLNNLLVAKELADKAERLVKDLQGRVALGRPGAPTE
jgi:hypothetical protein